MTDKISKDIKVNIQRFKELFKDADDVVFRNIQIGKKNKKDACFIFIDGLVDKTVISDYAIEVLFEETELDQADLSSYKDSLSEKISKEYIAVHDVKEESNFEKLVEMILSGETVLLIDGSDAALLLSTRGWPTRGIQEPQTETVVRGPRDGFVETLRFNTALLRRHIKDPKLKVKSMQVGRRSKTDVAVVYIEDIANEQIVNEVINRIQRIDIDAISGSTDLEVLIEDNYLSPFSQIENTERPDAAAASLYEGRVVIIVDNTPFVLIVPATIGTLFQSTEDYYTRWLIGTLIRFIRILSAILTTTSPALYISFTAYHPGLIPTPFTLYLAASRVNVPFPAVVEAFLMETTIEILKESGTRIAGPVGTTIGIVGGIIIGQAAVEAGIVSPLKIIITAITTISFFAIPSYEWASSLRIVRFILMLLAAVLGLYGVMIGIIILMVHFARLESFSVPFSAPYSGLGLKEGDLKDTLVKAPLQHLKYRPKFTFPKDRKRMK